MLRSYASVYTVIYVCMTCVSMCLYVCMCVCVDCPKCACIGEEGVWASLHAEDNHIAKVGTSCLYVRMSKERIHMQLHWGGYPLQHAHTCW